MLSKSFFHSLLFTSNFSIFSDFFFNFISFFFFLLFSFSLALTRCIQLSSNSSKSTTSCSFHRKTIFSPCAGSRAMLLCCGFCSNNNKKTLLMRYSAKSFKLEREHVRKVEKLFCVFQLENYEGEQQKKVSMNRKKGDEVLLFFYYIMV